MYGYDASFFLTEMYLIKLVGWENFTFTLRSIWNLRYVLLVYLFQKHVLIDTYPKYNLNYRSFITLQKKSTIRFIILTLFFFSVRLILCNFCIDLNIANNPCGSGIPYRRNDDAISCGTQSCPRGFRCNRGYGYAVCCRSFDHISFQRLYFFFIIMHGFLQIKLFLAFHCIIFTFDNLLEDYRRCPPR